MADIVATASLSRSSSQAAGRVVASKLSSSTCRGARSICGANGLTGSPSAAGRPGAGVHQPLQLPFSAPSV